MWSWNPSREAINREDDGHSQPCHPSRYENFALFEDGNKNSAMPVMMFNGTTDVVGHELILKGFACSAA